CVPLTSNLKWADAPGNLHLTARSTGLPKDSVANPSQIVSLDRRLLTDRAGKLTAANLRLVLAGIDTILGRGTLYLFAEENRFMRAQIKWIMLAGIAAMLAFLVQVGPAQQPAKGKAAAKQTRTAVPDADWPLYSRDLTSDRFSPLKQINATNVSQLK